MTTAFVLSGGGSLGAVQVGMLQALCAHGVQPDLLLGTSAGAMNAAWVADHGTSADSLSGLAAVWGGLRRRDIFPLDARQAFRGLSGRSAALSSGTRLRQLVEANTRIRDLDEAHVPLHLVATDLASGRSALLSTGSVTTAVLASAAIPGILPPVQHGDRQLIDGGVAGVSGVAAAVDLGADVVYVLPTGSACALPKPPRTAVGVALHALTLLIQQRLIHEVRAWQGTVRIKVMPPLCPLAVSPADFGHAAELVARGREAASEWLARSGTELPAQERFLSLHDHRPRGTAEEPADQCS
jgi:NTE family protein